VGVGGAAVSLIYRVYLLYSPNKWLEFETAFVSHGPGPLPVRNEALAGQEFHAIRVHKQLRMRLGTDGQIINLLLGSLQVGYSIDLTIELVRSTPGGPKIGVTVVSLAFRAQVTGFRVLGGDAYAFSFKVIGDTKEKGYDE
jgi:hypothetical protein